MTDTNHIKVLREIQSAYPSGGRVDDAIDAAITALSARASAGEGGEWVMVPERCLDGSMTIEEMVSAFIELHPGAKDHRHVFKLCATAAIKSAAPQPQQAPAQQHGHEDSRPCYMCGQRADAHPMVPGPRGGTKRGECPATPPAHGDGEGDAFEAWASSQKYDMTKHPLHWLFLNERTYAARQGWKAGMEYALTTRPTPEAQEARDAARYRLLRDRSVDDYGSCRIAFTWSCPLQRVEGHDPVDNAKFALDAAIDAALALPAQGEGNNG